MARGTRAKVGIDRSVSESHTEPASASFSPESLQTRIARRAYELYLQRDTTGGDEVSDWLKAEAEVCALFDPGMTHSAATQQPAGKSGRPSRRARSMSPQRYSDKRDAC